MVDKPVFIIVIVFVLISCQNHSSQLVPFEENDLWGYRDARGKIIIKPRFILATEFTGEIAAVATRDGWYFIDRNGETLTIRPYVYDNGPDYFQEGLARFWLDRKIGFIDERGRIVIAASFQYVTPFSDSLAAFCTGCYSVESGEHSFPAGGKWGFTNRQGDVVIEPQFDAIKKLFKDGKAEVKLNDEWLMIDRTGRVLK